MQLPEFVTKKYAGVPGWLIIAAGTVGAYLIFRKYQSSKSGAQATPPQSAGLAPYYVTSGGGGGGGDTGTAPTPVQPSVPPVLPVGPTPYVPPTQPVGGPPAGLQDFTGPNWGIFTSGPFPVGGFFRGVLNGVTGLFYSTNGTTALPYQNTATPAATSSTPSAVTGATASNFGGYSILQPIGGGAGPDTFWPFGMPPPLPPAKSPPAAPVARST